MIKALIVSSGSILGFIHRVGNKVWHQRAAPVGGLVGLVEDDPQFPVRQCRQRVVADHDPLVTTSLTSTWVRGLPSKIPPTIQQLACKQRVEDVLHRESSLG